MKTLNLIKDFCPTFNFQIGAELGYGASGNVYTLLDDSNKVIKVSILYDVDPELSIMQAFEKISSSYNYLKDYPIECAAKIYDFQFLTSRYRSTVDGPQQYILYFSILERLLSLSEEEKKIFKNICDAYNKESFDLRNVKANIQELSAWLDFPKEKVLTFWDSFLKSGVVHHDFHRRNIMKDKFNNYKIIDFDSITILNKG